MKSKGTYYLFYLLVLLTGCISDSIKENGVPEEIRQKLKISHIDINGGYTRALTSGDYGDYVFSFLDDGDELTASFNFVKSNSDMAFDKNKMSYAWVERKQSGDLTASFSPSIVLPSGGYVWGDLQMAIRFSDKYSGSNDVLFASTANDTTIAGGINVTEQRIRDYKTCLHMIHKQIEKYFNLNIYF